MREERIFSQGQKKNLSHCVPAILKIMQKMVALQSKFHIILSSIIIIHRLKCSSLTEIIIKVGRWGGKKLIVGLGAKKRKISVQIASF